MESGELDRAALLQEACGNDPELRREVEELLAQQSAAKSLLETPIETVVAAVYRQPHASLVGRRLGSLEFGALLGAGGMGEVYRARDSVLRRDVAVKVLPSQCANDRQWLARFEREAQVLALLDHSNIAQIYQFDAVDGVHALVMELIEGPTLAERIANRAFHLQEALSVAAQIASALDPIRWTV